MSADTVLLILSIAAGAYMAWNIGANDVANSMASAVGAKAITLTQAVIIAGVLNIVGATFIGSHVTKTIRKGIVDISQAGDPQLVLLGLLAALIAAAFWVFFATVKSLPVSTTHTLVGAVIGVGFARGIAVLDFGIVKKILGSWLITIPLSAIMTIIIFKLLIFIY